MGNDNHDAVFVAVNVQDERAVVSVPSFGTTGVVCDTRVIKANDAQFTTIANNCEVASNGEVKIDVHAVMKDPSWHAKLLQLVQSRSQPRHPTTCTAHEHNSGDHSHSLEDLGGVELPTDGLQQIGYVAGTEARSRARRHAVPRRLDEDQEFSILTAALQKGEHLLHHLGTLRSVQELRSAHFAHERREAALVSANIQTGETTKRYIGFLWQISASPPKAVCISFSAGDSPEELNVQCTCSPNHLHLCTHAKACLSVPSFKEALLNVVHDHENFASLFGSTCTLSQNWPIVCLPRKQANQQNATPATGQPGSTTNANPQNPQPNASTGTNPKWAFWVTFDTSRLLFVPMAKRDGIPFQCGMCRGNSARRGHCLHEFLGRATAKDSNLYDVDDADPDSHSNVENEDQVQVEDGNEGDGPELSMSRAETFAYCPSDVSRTLLPCKKEEQFTDKLYKRIEEAPPNNAICFVDARFDCVKCKREISPAAVLLKKRSNKVTLLTLLKGPVLVQFFDWTCPRLQCRKVNYFTGRHDGIFPVRQSMAYSTDYLYCLVDFVSRLNMSQRTAYESLNIVSKVSRKLLRFEREHGDEHVSMSPDDRIRNILQRRRVAEAITLFTNSLSCHHQPEFKKLFNCPTCEQPLSDEDKKQLGIKSNEGNDLDRYRGVVIDGTSCGIINKLPYFHRDNHILPKPSRTGRKFLNTTAVEKRVLKHLFHKMNEHLRWMLRDSSHSRCHFHLLSDPKKIGEGDLPFLKLLFRIADCTCDDRQSWDTTEPPTHQSCDLFHADYCTYSRYSSDQVLRTLSSHFRSMFRLTLHPFEAHVERITRAHLSDEEDGTVTPPTALQHSPITSSQGIQSQQTQPSATPQTGAVLLEEDLTALQDGVGRGHDRGGWRGRAQRGTSRGRARGRSRGRGRGRGRGVGSGRGRTRGRGRGGRGGGAVGQRQMQLQWALTITINNPRVAGQLLHSFLKLADFQVREHLALPYMCPPNGTQLPQVQPPYSEDCRTIRPGCLNMKTEVLSKIHIQNHNSVQQSLRTFSTCSHTDEDIICQPCRDSLISTSLYVENSNPSLRRFCVELGTQHVLHTEALRHMSIEAATLLQIHAREAEQYFKRLDSAMPQKNKDFHAAHASVLSSPFDEEDQTGISEDSGIVFPASRKYRKDILFDVKETAQCEKNYPVSQRFSPGVMTVQCCCEKPQLLGYIIMIKAESTALALTSILSCFQVPPRIVYYDNACNLTLSALTRVPWLLHTTKFVVDRFHYKSHTCSEYFDPDSYRVMDAHKTTTAESINARIEHAVPYLRYVNGNNYIPFLSVRFALLNVAARFRRQYGIDDLEDEDIWGYFRDSITCSCDACNEVGSALLHHRSVQRELQGYGPSSGSNDEQQQEPAPVAAQPSPAHGVQEISAT